MCVVADPSKAFLDTLHFEQYKAIEDFQDRLVQDRLAKGHVESVDHAINEDIECMVDSVSRSVDPAKDIVVDLSVGVGDDLVGAHSPLLTCIVELEHHLVGECSHFVRKRGNFLLNGLEQDELAKTAK